MRYQKHSEKGQSMFEVVIAIFIIAMVTISVVSLSTVSLSNSIFSRNKTLAGKYSQEAIEWIRGQREQNFASFKANAVGTKCMDTLSLTALPCQFINSIFKREVTFTTTTVSGKKILEVNVRTYWNDAKGYHESKYVTNFSDIREK
jgi:Tfp pilus assembly protein PilV